MNELDQERAEELTKELMIPIVAHLKNGPHGPERCLEALNALAAVVVLILYGAPERRKASAFFNRAMERQWNEILKQN